MLMELDIIKKIKYPSGQTQNLCSYLCDCGKIIHRLATSVKNAEEAHCGCKFDYIKDWKYGAHLKSRWNGINRRTVNGLYSDPKLQKSGPYVGVTICEDWKNSFKAFYDWSIKNNFEPQLHIDRINPKKGYSPDNCRYVPQSINNRNGARSKLDTIRVREVLLLHGVYSNLDIARVYEIDPSTLVNICKGVIWNDVFKLYATEKNKVRLNPINLLPIKANVVPGTIDFDDKVFIDKVLHGHLALKDGERRRLMDLRNEYILYSQYDHSKNNVKNFFDLLIVNITKDEETFDRYLKKKFLQNKDNIEKVTNFIKKIVTEDMRANYIMRFNSTFKLILKTA